MSYNGEDDDDDDDDDDNNLTKYIIFTCGIFDGTANAAVVHDEDGGG